MSRRSSRKSLAVLVAGFALVASGCGVSTGTEAAGVKTNGARSSGSTASTSTVVLDDGSFEGTGGAVFLRNAAVATAEVKTQKIAMTMTMKGLPAAGDVTISYDGAFDNEAGRGTLKMDLGGLLGSVGSLGSSGSGEDMGRIEMVMDGDTVYLQSPLFSMLGGNEKPWLKVAANDLSEGGSSLGGSMQTDPGAFLDFLKGAGGELETVGREDVRGESTTHVRTDLDIAQLMKDSSASERADMERQLNGLGGAGEALRKIPAEAWVDDNGYVRKFQMTFDLTGFAEGEAGMGAALMTMEIEMYDFNEPVTITVPDPAQVGELNSSLLGGN